MRDVTDQRRDEIKRAHDAVLLSRSLDFLTDTESAEFYYHVAFHRLYDQRVESLLSNHYYEFDSCTDFLESFFYLKGNGISGLGYGVFPSEYEVTPDGVLVNDSSGSIPMYVGASLLVEEEVGDDNFVRLQRFTVALDSLSLPMKYGNAEGRFNLLNVVRKDDLYFSNDVVLPTPSGFLLHPPVLNL